MNLYLISQAVNNGFETYDMAVVRAESEEVARCIHPNAEVMPEHWDGCVDTWGDWANAADVRVELLGTALDGTLPGVVCASFNAD